MRSRAIRSYRLSRLSLLVLAGGAALASGCNNPEQGAVSGGAIGALSGLAIGSIAGDAGEGAAIGAIVGVVGGAVIGDQNQRRAQEQQQAVQQASMDPPAPLEWPAPPILERLLGNWRIDGWSQDSAGQRTTVSGSATGSVDRLYFLTLNINVTDPRNNQPIQGTSVIGQDGGTRLSMTNSFSTSPIMARYEGEVDPSGQVMIFRRTSPVISGTNRRVVLRVTAPNQWSAEVWDRRSGSETMTEFLTMTRGN